MNPNKKVTLERDGKTQTVLIRQLPHDPRAVAGRKFRYGSGCCWKVARVEDAE